MKRHRFSSMGWGLVLVSVLAVGCGSKQNMTPTSDPIATNPSAPASYKDTSSPQAQRYNEAMKQTNSTKSPYSR